MVSAGLRVLIVDDDEVMRKLLREVLQKEGYSIEIAGSGEQAIQILGRESFPVVVSDIRMIEASGLDVLKQVKRASPESVVILMTGFGNMEGAIEAIQQGAFDYLSKPFKMDDFKALVKRAVRHWEAIKQSNNKTPAKSPAIRLDVDSRGLIGKSPCIVEVYKTLARAALSSSTVLIRGESGTGKELVARAIHENSQRKKAKFVAVNCGALSENLLESELFGHVKGSFTGAVADKAGLFEEAHGGTLFLDEIGDISPALQVKLLRVLQEGEFKPVGSVDSKKSDVRIIAATHRDLEAMVTEGKFREDLFYRLKVIEIGLPALRERIEDLPELVEFFLAKYSAKSGNRVSHVSEEALQLLKECSWPGNIRELEHAIERAVALTKTSVLYPEDFPPEIRKVARLGVAPAGAAADGSHTSLDDMEKAHILKVLQETGYNKSKASEILGIDRATLYRKAQRFGIELKGK